MDNSEPEYFGLMSRRHFLKSSLAFASATALIPSRVMAADVFPSRPVQFVVPYPAGGSNDSMARRIANNLARRWGQPVIVDNRPGAGGIVGASVVANAKPDGHTLGMISSSFTTSAAVQSKLPFDPLKSFAPIAHVGSGPLVAIISPHIRVNSLKELADLLKQRPGKLTYGSSGVGSTNHFAAALFLETIGTSALHVPYRGISPAITDLIGGHLDFIFLSAPSALPFISSKQVRALAVTSRKPWAGLKTVPTAISEGITGFEVEGWSGVLAPSGITPSLVAQLNNTINQVMLSAEMTKALEFEGLSPFEPMSPEDFGRIITADLPRWRSISKAKNIQAE
jgi:tripartite-type tricarboxylate transporter receptor subunit TctC